MRLRLGEETLSGLEGRAAVPAYDRRAVTAGIVHLGVGAFHRAHQAVYVDDCLAAGETGWGIIGASLRSPATRDALAPQDGLYTLSVRSGAGEDLRVIGSIGSLVVAPEDPAGLLAILVDPAIRIVSLTVTEKAYLRDPSGGLDLSHPDIVADLADPGRPRSVHGFLVEALARRRVAGSMPFTVLCCDNLPSNGATLHRLLVAFAEARGDGLHDFIRDDVACPSTVIDRIVPATTDADRERISARLGLDDAWPIVTEPYSEWVVEDRFPAGRPDFASVGVTLVRDVRPHEHMKIRLLNGSHSAMSYLGLLMGRASVAEAFGDPRIRRYVHGLWDEAIPTLDTSEGLDPAAYTRRLTERYDNPALVHRTAQIANDGSQKLPQRIVESALERLAAGGKIDHMATAIAAWIVAATARGRSLSAAHFTDPLDGVLSRLDPGGQPAAIVAEVFERAGFAAGSPGRAALMEATATRLRSIREAGPAAALDDLNRS